MSIIGLLLFIIVIGVLLWLVNSFIPMDAKIKQILNAVVVIALVIWLLFILLGFFGFENVPVMTKHRF